MEDLLPLYANMVHKLCPCEEECFRGSCFKILSKALFNTDAYDMLSDSNQKTIKNHFTEIAGILLGLYYPIKEESGTTFIYESESCKYLIENNDYHRMSDLVRRSVELSNELTALKKEELKRIQGQSGSTKVSMVYLTMVQEAQNVVIFAVNLLKVSRKFQVE
jgi:hypothetical protein